MNIQEWARDCVEEWRKRENKNRAGSHSPKNDAEKSPEQKMEAVIESIVTNSSMGDHFAYFNASPLCGSCGLVMCTEGAEYVWGKNFKLRVRCLNYRCHHNGILYEVVPEKSAVMVFRRVV